MKINFYTSNLKNWSEYEKYGPWSLYDQAGQQIKTRANTLLQGHQNKK